MPTGNRTGARAPGDFLFYTWLAEMVELKYSNIINPGTTLSIRESYRLALWWRVYGANKPMPMPKIILLIINIIGGIAVIGSYVWGLRAGTGGADALWGGTPAGIRPVYAISMLFAALGYFAFIYFILFRLDVNAIRPGFWIFYLIFLGILGASTLWMPLSNLFVANPASTLWIAIRIVLAIVGLSSCVLAGVLISLHAKETGLAYWLAVAGSVYFAFHTAVLDMILWPVLFKMQ